MSFLGTFFAQIVLNLSSSDSIERTASGSCSLHQQTFWLLIFDRIKQVLLLCNVVTSPCCWCSSSTTVLPSENILCQRKACALDIASSPKAYWTFSCVVVAFLLSLKQKNYGIRLRNFPWFHFHDKVQEHVLTSQASTPHWGIAKPCNFKWRWRKGRDQRLSVLAGCSIARTARRQLISLLYCRTSYPLVET